MRTDARIYFLAFGRLTVTVWRSFRNIRQEESMSGATNLSVAERRMPKWRQKGFAWMSLPPEPLTMFFSGNAWFECATAVGS